MKEKFSQSVAIQYGWKTVQKNFWFLAAIMITYLIVANLPDLLTGQFGTTPLATYNTEESWDYLWDTMLDSGIWSPVVVNNIFLSIVLTAAYIFIQTLVNMGVVKISLQLVDEKKSQFTELFSQTKLFWKYFFGTVLYSLITLAGIILFIIPGIIWAVRYQFYNYFIIDEGMGPMEALRKSAEITKGAWWDLFFFYFVKLIINTVGFLALIVGLLWSYPTTLLANAHVYRQLREGTKS